MVLAQCVPYRRTSHQSPEGDWYGSQVASNDLTEAVIRYNAVESVHFFEPDTSTMVKTSGAFSELDKKHGATRVKRFARRLLPDLAQEYDYLFLTHGVDFSQLGQIRLGLGKGNFPICALVHSIDSPRMLLSYLAAYIYYEPYDAIVVTSSAGSRAVRTLWNDAEQVLAQRVGITKLAEPEIVTIPLGVDVDFLAPCDKFKARHSLKLPLDRTILLYCGRLHPHDKADLEVLIKCMQRVLQRCPNAYLVIAGQDIGESYSALLEKVIAEEHLQSSITIIPNFPYLLKPHIYSAADIFVSPVDNIQETFGISLVEAMSCGLPIVASDWSGYRDLVLDGNNGFLVPTFWNPEHAWRVSRWAPISDSHLARRTLAANTVVDIQCLEARLCELIINNNLRRQFGAAGRLRAVSLYRWATVVKQFELLWAEQSARAKMSRSSFFLQDYAKAFSGYPSQTVNAKIALSVTEGSSEDVYDPQIIDHALSGIPIGRDLSNVDTWPNIDPVLSLWKKGTLTPIAAHESNINSISPCKAQFQALGSIARDINEIITNIVLDSVMNLTARLRFLHLGADAGYITEKIAYHFSETVAVEKDTRLTCLLKNRPLKHLKILDEWADDSKASSRYDLILIGPGYHPQKEVPDNLLRSLVPYLAPNGILLVGIGDHGGSLAEAVDMIGGSSTLIGPVNTGIWRDSAESLSLGTSTDVREYRVDVIYDSIDDACDDLMFQSRATGERWLGSSKSQLYEFLSQHRTQDASYVLDMIVSLVILRAPT